jgi:membrane protein implicated in regulation of membrane protease activity
MDWLHEGLHVGKISNDLKEQFSHVVALRVADPSLPSFWGFKALQYLTYFLLLGFFLLVMGGEAAWRGVLDAPGGESVLRLLLSTIQTLFSTKGLAALASYALLNLFFAFRFYRRYRRLLHRAAKKILDRMSTELLEKWEEKLDFMLDRLNALKEDILYQISAIPVLEKEEEEGGQTREDS